MIEQISVSRNNEMGTVVLQCVNKINEIAESINALYEYLGIVYAENKKTFEKYINPDPRSDISKAWHQILEDARTREQQVYSAQLMKSLLEPKDTKNG